MIELLHWVGLYIGIIGISLSLQWLHSERDGVSNHEPHDCLLNRFFRHRFKKTSNLRLTGLCARIHLDKSVHIWFETTNSFGSSFPEIKPRKPSPAFITKKRPLKMFVNWELFTHTYCIVYYQQRLSRYKYEFYECGYVKWTWSWCNTKCRLTGFGNPIVEIRRCYDRLIFSMRFPILVRWHLCIGSRTRSLPT